MQADPSGDYIRHFVPELRKLRGKGMHFASRSLEKAYNTNLGTAVHDPFNRMPKAEFQKLGYPQPIVVHKEVKDRAIRR